MQQPAKRSKKGLRTGKKSDGKTEAQPLIGRDVGQVGCRGSFVSKRGDKEGKTLAKKRAVVAFGAQ